MKRKKISEHSISYTDIDSKLDDSRFLELDK